MNEKKSANIIQIFPLLVYKNKIGLTENERSILIKEAFDQESKSKNLTFKKKTSAWTGDTQGFEFLYSNKKFKKLFGLISSDIKKYTKIIGFDNDKIDFYYQRAWATISRNNENIAPHKHLQSHISFAYYLKKSKNDGNLNFFNAAAQNEIAANIFNPSKDKDFFKVNFYNTNTINFSPEIDELYIFPSKTTHATSQNKTTGERISISADVSVVAKNSENMEFVLTPINKWKKF